MQSGLTKKASDSQDNERKTSTKKVSPVSKLRRLFPARWKKDNVFFCKVFPNSKGMQILTCKHLHLQTGQVLSTHIVDRWHIRGFASGKVISGEIFGFG